jgi:hypothetical protein
LSFEHVSTPEDEEEELDFEKDDLDESFIRHFYKNKNQVQIQYQED